MAPLTVLSWNVRYFGHGTQGLWSTDAWMHKVAWAIAANDPMPDVIALQEVELRSLRAGLGPRSQLERFELALTSALAANGRSVRYASRYFPAHRMDVGVPLMTTGLALLVSTDLTVESEAQRSITHVRLPAFARWKQRRIACRVRLRRALDRPPLDVFNTHLSLPAFLQGPPSVRRRMGAASNQLAEVDQLLAFARDRSEHALLVGDLNSLPDSTVVRRVIADGWVASGDDLPVDTAAFFHLRMQLDHVFCTPSVSLVGCRRHPVDSGPFRRLSDHAPQVVQVRWPASSVPGPVS